MKTGKRVVYQCHTGITDFAVPVWVGDRCAAAILGGQVVLSHTQKQEAFERIATVARQMGVEPHPLIAEYERIKVRTEQELEDIIVAVERVSAYLSKLAREGSVYAAETQLSVPTLHSIRRARTWETMNPADVASSLAGLREQDFTLRLILPFLERAGYENVKYCHGPSEAGCDIRFDHVDPLGARLYYGAQIKITKITGKAGSACCITALIHQAEAALSCHFTDEFTGESVRLDQFWFVSPWDITNRVKKVLNSHDRMPMRPLIRFLTGQGLIAKLKSFVPQLLEAAIMGRGKS